MQLLRYKTESRSLGLFLSLLLPTMVLPWLCDSDHSVLLNRLTSLDQWVYKHRRGTSENQCIIPCQRKIKYGHCVASCVNHQVSSIVYTQTPRPEMHRKIITCQLQYSHDHSRQPSRSSPHMSILFCANSPYSFVHVQSASLFLGRAARFFAHGTSYSGPGSLGSEKRMYATLSR